MVPHFVRDKDLSFYNVQLHVVIVVLNDNRHVLLLLNTQIINQAKIAQWNECKPTCLVTK